MTSIPSLTLYFSLTFNINLFDTSHSVTGQWPYFAMQPLTIRFYFQVYILDKDKDVLAQSQQSRKAWRVKGRKNEATWQELCPQAWAELRGKEATTKPKRFNITGRKNSLPTPAGKTIYVHGMMIWKTWWCTRSFCSKISTLPLGIVSSGIYAFAITQANTQKY